jgi:hypothetical protein
MFPIRATKPKSGGQRYRAYDGISFNDEMLLKVYEVADIVLAELRFGFDALRCDEHGWPVPALQPADDFGPWRV